MAKTLFLPDFSSILSGLILVIFWGQWNDQHVLNSVNISIFPTRTKMSWVGIYTWFQNRPFIRASRSWPDPLCRWLTRLRSECIDFYLIHCHTSIAVFSHENDSWGGLLVICSGLTHSVAGYRAPTRVYWFLIFLIIWDQKRARKIVSSKIMLSVMFKNFIPWEFMDNISANSISKRLSTQTMDWSLGKSCNLNLQLDLRS